jgi:hypothetical protein
MKKASEIVVALALVTVLFLPADPFRLLMPTEVQMVLLGALAAAAAVYAGLVFREKPADERESLHLYQASRIAYLAGTVALTAAIVVQDVLHRLDVWLPAVLGVMILTKLVVLLWARYRN